MTRVRVLQVSPFHPCDLEMGGPLHLIAHLATERASDAFQSIGVVAPVSRYGRTETRFRVYECGVVWRYRTVSVTEAGPLNEAVAEADLVLIHGYRHWLPVMAARQAAARRIPIAIHLHGMATRMFRSRIKKMLFDLTLGRGLTANARTLICSSTAELEKAREILPPACRFTVIPNAIERTDFQDHAACKTEWCRRLGLDFRRPLLVALGRINSTKNYEAILGSIPALPYVNLVIAGPAEETGYWDTLQSTARTAAGGNVRLIPGVYGVEKHTLLAAADVFVTATLVDSFNLTVAEALYQGTPVVYPSWIGIGEFLDNPIAVDVADLSPSRLAGAISTALSRGRAADSSGCPFTWENVRNHWDRLIVEAAAQGANAGGVRE